MDQVRAFDSLAHMVAELKLSDDEGTTLEFKSAKGGLPKSFWESFSAFSNTRGGYIVLGFDEKTGLPIDIDIDGRQKDIAGTLELKMSPPIAPHMQVHIVNGKKIILVKIHKAEPHQKPVYVLDRGPKKGAYKRVGSSNLNLSDDDLERIYVERSIQPADSRPLPEYSIDAIDTDLIDKWKTIAKTLRPASRLIGMDGLKFLQRLKTVSYLDGKWVPNRAGMLLFGKQEYVMSLFPSLEIQVTYVDGVNWKANLGNRPAKITFEGDSLLNLMTDLEDFSYRLVPEAPVVTSGKFGRNEDPIHVALREAIINILIHQDYSAHRHVKIRVFSDRLELENPGYSKKPPHLFDTLGSEIRNPVIAAAFEKCGWVEKEGTGLQTIKEAMKSLAMPEPSFISNESDNTFTVIFRWQNFVDRAILEWVNKIPDLKTNEREALVIAKQYGKVNNALIRSKLDLSNHVVSKILSRLCDLHYLRREHFDYYFQEPAAVGTAPKLHHGPLFELMGQQTDPPAGQTGKPPMPLSNPPMEISQSTHAEVNPPILSGGDATEPPMPMGGTSEPMGGSNKPIGGLEFPEEEKAIPAALLQQISDLTKKVPRQLLQYCIYELCKVRPFSKAELAQLLQKSELQIRNNGLRPLLRAGYLVYTDSNLRSENQKYVAVIENEFQLGQEV